MKAFLVSAFAGLAFPLLPLWAEWGFTSHVQLETWTVTTVVYVAATGLISRNQVVMIAALFSSASVAMIYGAVKFASNAVSDVPLIQNADRISGALIVVFSFCYLVERYSRHVTEAQPFLEIDT